MLNRQITILRRLIKCLFSHDSMERDPQKLSNTSILTSLHLKRANRLVKAKEKKVCLPLNSERSFSFLVSAVTPLSNILSELRNPMLVSIFWHIEARMMIPKLLLLFVSPSFSFLREIGKKCKTSKGEKLHHWLNLQGLSVSSEGKKTTQLCCYSSSTTEPVQEHYRGPSNNCPVTTHLVQTQDTSW